MLRLASSIAFALLAPAIGQSCVSQPGSCDVAAVTMNSESADEVTSDMRVSMLQRKPIEPHDHAAGESEEAETIKELENRKKSILMEIDNIDSELASTEFAKESNATLEMIETSSLQASTCTDPAYRFPATRATALCYSTRAYAFAGNGPCESWCTTSRFSGSLGCGNVASKLCQACADVSGQYYTGNSATGAKEFVQVTQAKGCTANAAGTSTGSIQWVIKGSTVTVSTFGSVGYVQSNGDIKWTFGDVSEKIE